jgi:hypothetical protein
MRAKVSPKITVMALVLLRWIMKLLNQEVLPVSRIRLLTSHLNGMLLIYIAHPFKEIPNDPRGEQSSVFLLVQPPASAGPFSLSSEGVYEFCHWAILISSIKLEKLKEIITHLNCGSSELIPGETHLGLLIEIRRHVTPSSSIKVFNSIDPFTAAHLIQYFPNCSVIYAGTTTEHDGSIISRGEKRFKLGLTHP